MVSSITVRSPIHFEFFFNIVLENVLCMLNHFSGV